MSADKSRKPPGEYVREELDRRGWTQAELARITGRPLQTLNAVIQGNKSITPDTAAALGAAFGTGAAIWLEREALYRLADTDVDTEEISRLAHLHCLAPIRDMEKRQWISPARDAAGLERELKAFFGVESLDQEPKIGAATRKSDFGEPLTPSQRAWCFRVRQLANSLLVTEFKESELDKCAAELRKLAAFPQESHKVARLFGSYGIRFVMVEPLPGCKVDGVAMWLNPHCPAIGISARYDRIDSIWFTICHEFRHIVHRDESPVDVDTSASAEPRLSVKPPMERRADEEAAAMLVPKDEMDSFVKRVGPLYSKDRIVQFANRIKMHPGIIVGQLQHRAEIGFHANREMLSKIRDFMTSATLTDGWGHSISPGSLK